MKDGVMLDRRRFLVSSSAVLGGWVSGLLPAIARSEGAERPRNVLFICVDDLRPQLPCYGKDFMVTPNLDRLAGRGVVFNNHFAQVPTCGASRCCLLTGMRPHRPGALNNDAFEGLPRTDVGEAISMPQLFRENGYKTVSVGKVSHAPDGRRAGKPTSRFGPDGKMLVSGPNDGEPELALAWDKVYGPTAAWGDSWSAFFGYAGGKTRSYGEKKSPPVEAADVPDTGYPDGLIAEAAIGELRGLKDGPFFLSVGFYKPHLPFCAPKKYWDLYDRDAIPLAEHRDPPKGVDKGLSLHRNGEVTGNYASLKDPREATEEEARRLRHGYFAAVSYVDAQIGKVLDELDRLGLRDNTIVVVWGDHGWHLGDLHVWGKHTTFEFSLRSTLIVDTPELPARGVHADGLVETIDLYPTLAAACGLTAPQGLGGVSLLPVLEDSGHPGKDGAFGYWRKGSNRAVTLRTARYRLVEWMDKGGKTLQVELYDHKNDPDETKNVASAHPEVLRELLPRLHAETPRLLGN